MFKAVLYTANSQTAGFDDATLVAQMLPAGERKVVQRGGSFGRYVPSGLASPTRDGRESGHLVYVHEGTLFAAPFDLDRLDVTGQPVPALEGVTTGAIGAAQFVLSNTGSLVYLPGDERWQRGPDLLDGPHGKDDIATRDALNLEQPELRPARSRTM